MCLEHKEDAGKRKKAALVRNQARRYHLNNSYGPCYTVCTSFRLGRSRHWRLGEEEMARSWCWESKRQEKGYSNEAVRSKQGKGRKEEDFRYEGSRIHRIKLE